MSEPARRRPVPTRPDRRPKAAKPVDSTPFPWIGLLTLAGAIFVCVTGEFLPTGLLPQLAEGLRVPESQIGLLVTVYAGTVVVSAPLLTTLTRRIDRKTLVVIVLCAFALTNVLVAVASEYWIVVVARVVGGLSHGLFWAVVGAYAAHLVPKRQLARAVAVTSSGATAAFVLGVPIGTALGNALGWRLAFAVMAGAIAVLVVLVMIFLPRVDHVHELRTGEISIPARKDPTVFAVAALCLIIVVLMIGQNMFYTYIVPFLTGSAGFAEADVSVMLFVYGGAGAIGLLLVGVLGSRYPRSFLFTSFVVVALSVAVIGLFPQSTVIVVIGLIVWGVSFGSGPALLQTRMLHTSSPRIRDQASAWFTVAFNIGIGGGALLGGFVFDGIGVGALPFFEAGIVAVGVLLIVAVDIALRRRSSVR